MTFCTSLERLMRLVAVFGMRSTSFAVSEGLTHGINPYLVKDFWCHWLSASSTTNSLTKSHLMPCMNLVSLKFHQYDCEQFLPEVANVPSQIFCFLLFHAHIQIPYINMPTPKSVPSCWSACKIHTLTCVNATQPWKQFAHESHGLANFEVTAKTSLARLKVGY